MARKRTPVKPPRIYSPYGPAKGAAYVERYPGGFQDALGSSDACFLVVGPRESGRTSTALAIAGETPWGGAFRENPITVDCQGDSFEDVCTYVLSKAGASRATSKAVTITSEVNAELSAPGVKAGGKTGASQQQGSASFSRAPMIDTLADEILARGMIVVFENAPLLTNRDAFPNDALLQLCNRIKDKASSGSRGRVIMTIESDPASFSRNQLPGIAPTNLHSVKLSLPMASGIRTFQDDAYKRHGVKFLARIRSEIRRTSAGQPGLYHFLSDYGLERFRTDASHSVDENGGPYTVGHFDVWACIGDSIMHSGVYASFARIAKNEMWHYIRSDMYRMPRERTRAALLWAMIELDGDARVKAIIKRVKDRCPLATRQDIVREINGLRSFLESTGVGNRSNAQIRLRGITTDKAETLARARSVLERGEFMQHNLDFEVKPIRPATSSVSNSQDKLF